MEGGERMKRIALSLVSIVAALAVVAGATVAVFTDRAVLENNTFATGTLEIRLNGQERLAGFNFTNAAPGDSTEKVFDLNNYGSPYFPGPSTLPAEGLFATAQKQTGGDQILYDALTAKLYANAGWGGCSNPGVAFVSGKGCTVYDGLLKDLSNEDILLATQWGIHPSLPAGNSLRMTLVVGLPESAENELQGKSTTFDLLVDAQNPFTYVPPTP
jgi:predicted ribosomally synthesized peptide with SipW-like signal peptide